MPTREPLDSFPGDKRSLELEKKGDVSSFEKYGDAHRTLKLDIWTLTRKDLVGKKR